ncbi:hypothetical protein A6770_35025 [Nostoc minutum NIES-26]|uniref:Uncharacterized protein n=1 Tax=Nostoc minutum NIES-26 TaxID=1844469 RepID=A0A367S2Q6_9NOSO|nr:hypothetical protein A6770_35025 [Nostoc minutum NIES-26]
MQPRCVNVQRFPISKLNQKPRGKYRWLVEFDCVDGFAIETSLSEIGALKAGEIARSYLHKTISVLGKSYSYFCVRYTSQEDGVMLEKVSPYAISR